MFFFIFINDECQTHVLLFINDIFYVSKINVFRASDIYQWKIFASCFSLYQLQIFFFCFLFLRETSSMHFIYNKRFNTRWDTKLSNVTGQKCCLSYKRMSCCICLSPRKLHPIACKESGKQRFARGDNMTKLGDIFSTRMESITGNFRINLKIDIVEGHVAKPLESFKQAQRFAYLDRKHTRKADHPC